MLCRLLRITVPGFCLAMLLVASISARADEVFTWGWNEVRVLQVNETNTTTLWTWQATNSSLPQSYWPQFDNTSECKPCPGGKVMVTASTGGVDELHLAAEFFAQYQLGHAR